MGHRKLAVLLKMGKNRVKRVMKKYGIAARRKKKRYVIQAKRALVPNVLRDAEDIRQMKRCLFSDIFEDSPGRSHESAWLLCSLETHTAFLSLAFDYQMRADLVVSTIELMALLGSWHDLSFDQGSQYGAEQTRMALLRKGFVRSMSRAGTPTDNGYAERFVGHFKLAVAERRSYRTLGEFLRAAEHWINFYNQLRPHEGLHQQSPDLYASEHSLPTAPYLSLL